MYGSCEKNLVLMKLEGHSIKALAKAECSDARSYFNRNMKLFTYKRVSFVGVCQEMPYCIVLYANYKHRLFMVCYHKAEANGRPISFNFDEKIMAA